MQREKLVEHANIPLKNFIKYKWKANPAGRSKKRKTLSINLFVCAFFFLKI